MRMKSKNAVHLVRRKSFISTAFSESKIRKMQQEIYTALIGMNGLLIVLYILYENYFGMILSIFTFLQGIWAKLDSRYSTYLFNSVVQLLCTCIMIWALSNKWQGMENFFGTKEKEKLCIVNIIMGIVFFFLSLCLSLSTYSAESSLSDTTMSHQPLMEKSEDKQPKEEEKGEEKEGDIELGGDVIESIPVKIGNSRDSHPLDSSTLTVDTLNASSHEAKSPQKALTKSHHLSLEDCD